MSTTPSAKFATPEAAAVVPRTMRAVQLSGTGFESLAVREVPVPEPNDDQILCRVDAFTVCTSILKLISQGSDHTFLNGWDPARFPITIGDEGAVTVATVGRNLAGKYSVGEKCALQPAVDHPPINHRERYRDNGAGMKKTAVGYTLGGTFAQYLLIQEEVLAAGCLVRLPTQDLGYYEISMSEPLSCVVSAQDHHVHLRRDPTTHERIPQKGILPGGVTAVFGTGAMGRLHIELALSYRPRAVVVFDVLPQRLEWVRAHIGPRAERLGIRLFCEQSDPATLQDILRERTGQPYADDVIDATGVPKVQEIALNTVTGPGSVFNSFGGLAVGHSSIPVDMRKVHYDESIITGSSGGTPHDTRRTLALIAEGHFDVGSQIRVVGDLDDAIHFLELYRDKKVDGKALVYPHAVIEGIIDVPGSWSRDQEHALLDRCLAGGSVR